MKDYTDAELDAMLGTTPISRSVGIKVVSRVDPELTTPKREYAKGVSLTQSDYEYTVAKINCLQGSLTAILDILAPLKKDQMMTVSPKQRKQIETYCRQVESYSVEIERNINVG